MKNQTAILIFANTAEKDAERKSFLSKNVFSELNRQTLIKVEKSGIPYFHISENQQKGNNFGERFTNAIESIFEKGFQQIITIGNDTPHLKTNHLIETTKKLKKNNLVLGPSKDGGFYLMGIKKEHFNKQTFLKLPWQTSRLQRCISSISNTKNLEIKLLEYLNDIDKKEDVITIISSFKSISSTILSLLKRCFFNFKTFLKKINFHIKETFYQPNFNKGSPNIFA